MRSILLVLAFLGLGGCAAPPIQPGSLLLSNPNFVTTHVEAVITANSDCNARDAGYVSTLELVIPTNATRFIDAPAGADVCWRRDRDPDQPVAGLWTPWDRAYLAPGRTLDAKL